MSINQSIKIHIYKAPYFRVIRFRGAVRHHVRHLPLTDRRPWTLKGGRYTVLFQGCILHCVWKKPHWCSTLTSTQINRFSLFLAEMLPRECAIKRRFVIPPLVTNVSALPRETRTPEIMSFQSCCIPCLENEMPRWELRNNICTLYLILRPYCLQKLLNCWSVSKI